MYSYHFLMHWTQVSLRIWTFWCILVVGIRPSSTSRPKPYNLSRSITCSGLPHKKAYRNYNWQSWWHIVHFARHMMYASTPLCFLTFTLINDLMNLNFVYHLNHYKKIRFFLLGKLVKRYPKWPLSNLMKVPSWTSRFDMATLIRSFRWSFWLVFVTKFFYYLFY